MSNNVKSNYRRTALAICILAMIGATFGLLYAMEYLTSSNRKSCTKAEVFSHMLECSTTLAKEINSSHDRVGRIPPIRGNTAEYLQSQFCGLWNFYRNCTRDVLINCGLEADSELQERSSQLPQCFSNNTTFEKMSLFLTSLPSEN